MNEHRLHWKNPSETGELVGAPHHDGGVPSWMMALAAGATLAIGTAALYSAMRGATRYREHTYRRANQELQANARRALEMKRAAGPQANIPEHRTSHDGGVRGGQVGYTDTSVGREPTYTPNLKRSHIARSGDAS